MSKRRTIGSNPLDLLISPQTSQPIVEVEPTPAEDPRLIAVKNKIPSDKQRLTVQISHEVIEKVKNAVFWTPGMTLAAFAEDALSKAVERLEKSRGDKFPQRTDELKTGRPFS